MGVLGILIESLRVPFRTGRLGILLAFSFVIPSSLIFITNVFFLRPLYLDVSLKANDLQNSENGTPQYDELVSGMEKDVRVILGQEAVFFVTGHILSVLTTVATIYASAVTYSGGKLSSKDLFMRIRSTWKRTLITWLCITVIKLGCLFVLVFWAGLLAMIMAQLGTALLIALAILVALSSLLCYLYFAMVWELGVVISVMEDGYQGFGALGKAGELITGRRLQGLLLCLLITITQVALFWIFGLQTWSPKFSDNTGATDLAIAVILTDLSCLMTLYSTVVYTVFYCVCKENHGDEIEEQGTSGYSLIPNTTQVDSALT